MDRQVTPPKRVSSPTWGPPPPRKQAQRLNVSIKKNDNNNGVYTSYNYSIFGRSDVVQRYLLVNDLIQYVAYRGDDRCIANFQ